MAIDPRTVLAGTQLLSGAFDAYAILQTDDLNRKLSDLNIAQAEIEAQEFETHARSVAARQFARGEQVQAGITATLAARGIDVGFGTAATIQQEARTTNLLNTLDIEAQGRRQALGIKSEITNERLRQELSAIQARLAATRQIGQAAVRAGATYIGGYSTGSPVTTQDRDLTTGGTIPSGLIRRLQTAGRTA